MKISLESIIGVGGCALSLLGLGYAFGIRSRMKAVCEKLDTAIDQIENDTEIEIPAKLIDQAVRKAADREAGYAVKQAVSAVLDETKREISEKVAMAVKARYDCISDGVTSEIARNVAKIDETRLKKDVLEKAKEQIAEKFDGKLDDMLEEFNKNLQNIGRIYKSIARSFAKEDIQL